MADSNDPTERRARAEQRRLTWQGGVATFAEMADVDDAFWASSTPTERFLAVWELDVSIVGLEDLITMKAAAGRDQDLVDLKRLRRVLERRTRGG